MLPHSHVSWRCAPARRSESPALDAAAALGLLTGRYGQVTSLPDRRKAYGSSPLVKFLHTQRTLSPSVIGPTSQRGCGLIG